MKTKYIYIIFVLLNYFILAYSQDPYLDQNFEQNNDKKSEKNEVDEEKLKDPEAIEEELRKLNELKAKLEKKYRQLKKDDEGPIIEDDDEESWKEYYFQRFSHKIPSDMTYYQTLAFRSTNIQGRNAFELSIMIITTSSGFVQFFTLDDVFISEFNVGIDIYRFELSFGRPPVIVFCDKNGLFKTYALSIHFHKKLIVGDKVLITRLTKFIKENPKEITRPRFNTPLNNDIHIAIFHIRDTLLSKITYPFYFETFNRKSQELDMIIMKDENVIIYNPLEDIEANLTMNETITAYEKIGGRIAISAKDTVYFLYLYDRLFMKNKCTVYNGTITSLRFDATQMGYLYVSTDNGYLYLFHFHTLLTIETKCDILTVINVNKEYKIATFPRYVVLISYNSVLTYSIDNITSNPIITLVLNNSFSGINNFTFTHPLRHNLFSLYLCLQVKSSIIGYIVRLPSIIVLGTDEINVSTFKYGWVPKVVGAIIGFALYAFCTRKKENPEDEYYESE